MVHMNSTPTTGLKVWPFEYPAWQKYEAGLVKGIDAIGNHIPDSVKKWVEDPAHAVDIEGALALTSMAGIIYAESGH